MSQDAARRCIEILGTEFEKWNSVGEKLLVGRMEHNLATTIVKSYITGIAQPGRIVQYILRKLVQHTNTSSMSGDSTTSLFCRDPGSALWAKILGEERPVFLHGFVV